MNLMAGSTCGSKAVSVRPSVAFSVAVQFHNFTYDPSGSRLDNRQMLVIESVSYGDEPIPIKNVFCVFDSVEVNDFKIANAVIFG